MAREKTENINPSSPLATSPQGKGSVFFNFTKEELHQTGWEVLNFATMAAVTTASIIAVQSPIRTLIVNLSKNGTFMPAMNGGFLAGVRALYAGTYASLSGSAIRTAYVTGTTKNKPKEMLSEEIELIPEEEAIEPGVKRVYAGANYRYVMSAAFGDFAITQIPESLSTLRKVPGLLPQGFKWYTPNNMYQLFTGGALPRYATGLINFYALCETETRIANALPIEACKTKHFLAGALSGAGAAVISYPLAAFKDYTLVHASYSNGQIKNEGSWNTMARLVRSFQKNPELAAKSFWTGAIKQLPLRVGLTGMIFSIIAGVGETLGKEPLKTIVPERFQPSVGKSSQGFFGAKAKSPATTEEYNPSTAGPKHN